MTKKATPDLEVTYYLKVNLFNDGTPLWHGVVGKSAIKPKMAELQKLGYHPILDHTLTTKTK
ncbi:MAG: hypothetical protein ABL903_17985 [Methylococcales bacterium]